MAKFAGVRYENDQYDGSKHNRPLQAELPIPERLSSSIYIKPAGQTLRGLDGCQNI